MTDNSIIKDHRNIFTMELGDEIVVHGESYFLVEATRSLTKPSELVFKTRVELMLKTDSEMYTDAMGAFEKYKRVAETTKADQSLNAGKVALDEWKTRMPEPEHLLTILDGIPICHLPVDDVGTYTIFTGSNASKCRRCLDVKWNLEEEKRRLADG